MLTRMISNTLSILKGHVSKISILEVLIESSLPISAFMSFSEFLDTWSSSNVPVVSFWYICVSQTLEALVLIRLHDG